MAQANDNDRFTALLTAHESQLRKVTLTYGVTQEDREDLHQEILVQLWRSFASYDPERAFATWMYRVALNVAISHVRRVARDRRITGAASDAHDLPDPRSAAADGGAGTDLLQRLLATLDEFDRALLLLHLEERSYAEIADVLGLSESNVGTRLSRIRQRLRDVAASAREQEGIR